MAKKNVKENNSKNVVEKNKNENLDVKIKNKSEDLNEKVKNLTIDLDDYFNIDKKSTAKTDNVVEKTTTIESGGDEWLEEQIQLLTIENEKFEKDIIELKRENQKLKNEFVGMYNSEGEQIVDFKKKILLLYNELKSRYMGDNPQNVRWTDVKISYLMERIEKDFPFV